MLKPFMMLSLCICAVFFDLRTNKIPNMLCASACTAGLLIENGQSVSLSVSGRMGASFYSAYLCGLIRGTASWLAAVCVPLFFGFLLHRHRLMGAGDTKLLAALCGIAGYKAVLPLCALSLLAGGVLSLIVMVCYSGFRVRLRTLAGNAAKASRSPSFRYDPDLLRNGSLNVCAPSTGQVHLRELLSGGRIHFSIPILCAVILYSISQTM